MKIFISGGAKNGKSMFAQKCAQKFSEPEHLWYLATMEPHDDEDHARIKRHRKEREGWGFNTAEWGRDIVSHANEFDMKGTYLVDSVTALLTNEMFGGMNGKFDSKATEKAAAELVFLSEKVKNIVFVSDNLYCDSAFYDEWTEAFRRGLGEVDRCLASVCDVVTEFCCGQIIYYKGAELI